MLRAYDKWLEEVVHVWDTPPTTLISNLFPVDFEGEWPPHRF